MSTVYNKDEIINDFLIHDLNQSALARFYDEKYYPGYISSQTISKILNNKNLPLDIKEKIMLKCQELSHHQSNLENDEKQKLLTKIDRELVKMVKLQASIDEETLPILRTTYLYLNNCTYAEIAALLGLSKGTISKYLNQVVTRNILNPVTMTLLAEKKQRGSKFNDKNDDKVKKVIALFIECNGDYQKTITEARISERTLSRYLAMPNLNEILSDELYEQLTNLIKRNNHQKAMLAASNSARRRRIKATLKKATSLREKRLASILELVLLDNVATINDLCVKMNLQEATVLDYLKADAEIEKIFGPYIYSEYQIRKTSLLNEEHLDYEIAIVANYLKSRYSYENMFEQHKIDISQLKKFLGDDIIDEISKHAKEVTRIRKACPRDKYVIDDPEMVSITREDLYYVTSEDYRRLKHVASYFKHYGNLQSYLCECEQPYQAIHTDISWENLKDLLNDKAYHLLQIYLYYENIFMSVNELQYKGVMIRKTMETLVENGYDISKTLKKLNMPLSVLERIVRDKRLSNDYISEIINIAIEKAEAYKKMIESNEDRELLETLIEKHKYL